MPGDASLDAIRQVFADRANDPTEGLVLVDSEFVALPRMPADLTAPGPRMFPLPAKGEARERGSGPYNALEKWAYFIDWFISVGQLPNDIGALNEEGEKFIRPFYALYNRSFTVGGTVDYIELGQFAMGQYEFAIGKAFGLMVPVTYHQKVRTDYAP
jgi:hypothetical protein